MFKYNYVFNNEEYLADFIVRNTYNSNAIEGSSMSQPDTYLSLYEKDVPVKASTREIYEATNHKKAWEFILNAMSNQDIKVDNDFIIKLNQIINQDIMYIGGYRLGGMKIIGSDKTFPHPLEVNELMNRFINHYNQLLTKPNISYEEIAASHIEYINIHPFPDGNGRSGRLLTNILLLVHDYPPMTILLEDKSKYFNIMETGNANELANIIEESCNKELTYINYYQDIENSPQI